MTSDRGLIGKLNDKRAQPGGRAERTTGGGGGDKAQEWMKTGERRRVGGRAAEQETWNRGGESHSDPCSSDPCSSTQTLHRLCYCVFMKYDCYGDFSATRLRIWIFPSEVWKEWENSLSPFWDARSRFVFSVDAQYIESHNKASAPQHPHTQESSEMDSITERTKTGERKGNMYETSGWEQVCTGAVCFQEIDPALESQEYVNIKGSDTFHPPGLTTAGNTSEGFHLSPPQMFSLLCVCVCLQEYTKTTEPTLWKRFHHIYEFVKKHWSLWITQECVER